MSCNVVDDAPPGDAGLSRLAVLPLGSELIHVWFSDTRSEGGDNGLDPVSHAKLGQHMADVGLRDGSPHQRSEPPD